MCRRQQKFVTDAGKRRDPCIFQRVCIESRTTVDDDDGGSKRCLGYCGSIDYGRREWSGPRFGSGPGKRAVRKETGSFFLSVYKTVVKVIAIVK